MIMSLLNEVQKYIEAHPGCTSGDIADAFAGYSRQRVLQSASKLRQSGRVTHRCEGDTRRHLRSLKVLPLVIPHTAAPVSMRGNTSPACVTS